MMVCISRSRSSSSVVTGQKTARYSRVIRYFSTRSISLSFVSCDIPTTTSTSVSTLTITGFLLFRTDTFLLTSIFFHFKSIFSMFYFWHCISHVHGSHFFSLTSFPDFCLDFLQKKIEFTSLTKIA